MKNKFSYKYLFFIPIIFVIIVFIKITYDNYETYENYEHITFLSKEETQDFIKKDDDNYIKNLSIYDLRARKVKTNNEYLSIVIENCLDFDENQKRKLAICAKEAKQFFNNKNDWIFATINNNYENGYPHTRANIIFLSTNVINSNNSELIKTLIHESVHIFQRYNKDIINEYLANNNYQISRKKNKNSLIRSNPDLDEYIYKDKNGTEMMANYSSENPTGINDITIKNLLYEHPFEKMAYEIGEEYSKSLLMKYKDIN